MALALDTRHARAIVWAQWRSLRNRLPRSNKGALAFSILIGVVWYGMFLAMAAGLAGVFADAADFPTTRRALPAAFLICFMYWQIVPLLLASKGSSIDLRKLLAYPIRPSEFFALDVLLRLTIASEVLIVLGGAFTGLLLNSSLHWWAAFALVPYVLFNMFFAVGIHDLIERLVARRGIREIIALLFIVAIALPQLLVMRASREHFHRLSELASWIGWPWRATADLAGGKPSAQALLLLSAWMVAAYIFARWQFGRTMQFDPSEAGASPRLTRAASRLDWFYRVPGVLFRDPLGILVEKELRTLVRSPRFRLVFAMGFSFGLIIWWPVAFGHSRNAHSFLGDNYVTVVSLYAVMLLSEVLFWNVFGFDRAAAQLYFVAPLKPGTVLKGKNLAASFFVALEVTMAVGVCALLRLPIALRGILEAYAVTTVITLLMLSIGNLTSVYSPRAVDPTKSFRNARSGRVQALMLVIYPVAAVPLFLAYGARYAFDSEAAFFGVLALAAIFSGVFYRISMETAVGMVETRKESILEVLSRGQGPIES